MRLLSLADNDNFAWTVFNSSDIPPYAILSHTWGSQEVTYTDLLEDNGRSKNGRRKLEFCGTQAKADGLDYFWVDTCCIDKRDNSELSEAINSMYRWYQNAKICYAYLSDVDSAGKADVDVQIRRSKWFTRGWTLQELLAPRSVVFFNCRGTQIGTRDNLAELISEVTAIPTSVLDGLALHMFSIDARLSWAKDRQTTKEEDAAYSLLGIFNVFMPLLYGEGKSNAFRRLRKEIDEILTAWPAQRAAGIMQRKRAYVRRLPDVSTSKGIFVPSEGGHINVGIHVSRRSVHVDDERQSAYLRRSAPKIAWSTSWKPHDFKFIGREDTAFSSYDKRLKAIRCSQWQSGGSNAANLGILLQIDADQTGLDEEQLKKMCQSLKLDRETILIDHLTVLWELIIQDIQKHLMTTTTLPLAVSLSHPDAHRISAPMVKLLKQAAIQGGLLDHGNGYAASAMLPEIETVALAVINDDIYRLPCRVCLSAPIKVEDTPC